MNKLAGVAGTVAKENVKRQVDEMFGESKKTPEAFDAQTQEQAQVNCREQNTPEHAANPTIGQSNSEEKAGEDTYSSSAVSASSLTANCQCYPKKTQSVRLRIFMMVIATIVSVVAIGLGSSYMLVAPSIQNSAVDGFDLLVDMSDKLVSSEIDIIKMDVDYIAQQLRYTKDDEKYRILEDEMKRQDNIFTSLTILNHDRALWEIGNHPTAASLLGAPYLQSAFEGTTVLSTTREEHDGALSIHVCSKISDDLVLSATIDGLYFQNQLEDFEIWDSGYVFLIDENGTHISCNDPDCVENRENFHIMLGNGYEYLDTGEILHDIQTIGTGVKEYRLKGEDMVIAFKNVTSSASGWSVGVIAPLDESSLRDTNTGMLVAGLVSLILAVFAGVIASRVIEKPYIEAWEAERRSEEANESKSAFLANVSHEMRTPLNAIIGLTELCLSSEKMEPAVENYCEKTHTAGVTLLGIINDILDLSKMEAGKLEIIAVDYDTPSLINDTVTINMVRIGSKPIEFKLRVDENLPSRLHGDDLRVKQMFNNLLSNAFKYTEKGEVVMDISGEMKEDGYWLEVSVADSGIGIKPENISKLFCNYNQVDTKANRKIEGTGLGLALTKQLVELMDGSVTVTSEYGVGSTFTVRFRQDVINAAAIGKDVVTQLQSLRFVEEKRSRGARFIRAHLPYARVLIVDDVAVNLDVARGLMKPYQMQIDCVKSGIEAIELIRAGKPRYDAIFMDHMMPEMDGVEATKIIREQIDSDYARTIPIIALTANAIVGNEEMFLSSGFQAFLSKPIDTMRLDAVINQYVRNRTKEKEYALRKAEGTLERREGTDRRENSDRRQNSDRRSGIDRRVVEGWSVVGVNITKGIKRYDDDIEAYYDVVESYINNTPELMEKLGSHLDANSLADYGIIVHGVKGSSRAICADAVGDLAEELEFGAKAGDEALVREKHPVLVEQISKLLEGLKEAFAEYGPQTNLPTREKPDPLALDALLEAAKSFDIDAVDAAMHEIDSYTYSNDQGLVAWLHEQLKVMGFKNIVERLSGGD